MVTLDLADPDAPDLLHTYSGYSAAHDLVQSLGLRASQSLLDRGENAEGRRLYGASIEPLDDRQRHVLRQAADERHGFEAKHQRLPSLDDGDWLTRAWQRASAQLPLAAPGDDGEPAGPSDEQLRALFSAVVSDPRITAPAPSPRAAAAPAAGKKAAPPAASPAAPPATAASPAALDLEALIDELRDRFYPDDRSTHAHTLDLVRLIVKPAAGGSKGGVWVVVQFFVFDQPPGGDRIIRDIKEQEIYLGEPEILSGVARLATFFEAQKLALSEVFARKSPKLDQVMPYDLFFPDVLGLKKATTAEDMRKALVVKSRLGKYL